MYDQFYGFTERPFSLLPDPDFLFLGEKHRAALDTLELAIFNHSGFCVISGEIGAGKTTLTRELLNRLNDDIQVGLVSNTHPSFGELMQWIMAAYGLPGGTEDRLALHKRFIDFVIQSYADGRHTLLIIDEAQNLSLAALEELRMLSNVNSEKDLVLQIILIGQNELRENLQKPELAQFAQRISIDYYLGGLTVEETALYIQHRVAHAGGAADLFSADACRQVFEYSQGIPRVINRLCDLSLVYGFAKKLEQINTEVVLGVANEQRMGEAMEIARKQAADPALVKKPLITDIRAADSDLEARKEEARKEEEAKKEETRKERDAEPVASQEPVSDAPQKPEPSDVHPELQVKPVSDDSAPARPARQANTDSRQADLHTLVVNAEKTSGSRSVRGSLLLFLGVAVMAGTTAWMSRDAWLPAQQVATHSGPVTVEPSDKAAQAAREKVQREEAARLAKREAEKTENLEQEKREQAANLARQKAAETEKFERAELEKASRKKAQRENEARLAEQKAAEKVKLEQVKREKASREKANRIKAARLVKQKAAKKAKRKKADRIAKQRVVEKARREEATRLANEKEQLRREHAARALLGTIEWSEEDDDQPDVPVVKSAAIPAQTPREQGGHSVDQKEQERRERAARAMLGSVDWSEEDDEELADIPDTEFGALNPPGTATASATVAGEGNSKEIVQDADGFSSNPCDGPTARFLSTCR